MLGNYDWILTVNNVFNSSWQEPKKAALICGDDCI